MRISPPVQFGQYLAKKPVTLGEQAAKAMGYGLAALSLPARFLVGPKSATGCTPVPYSAQPYFVEAAEYFGMTPFMMPIGGTHSLGNNENTPSA